MHYLLGMKQNPLPADFIIGRRKCSFFLGIPVAQGLVIRAKYTFFFRAVEMKNQRGLSIVNLNPESRQSKSPSSKRTRLFKKKMVENEQN